MRIATSTTHQLRQAAKRFVALVVAATLCGLMAAEPLLAKAQLQSPSAEATKAQVRDLHTRGSQMEVTLADGTRLRGRIISVEDDSFTMSEDKTGRKVAWQYAQVIAVKKKGLSGRAKALTGAIIGGGVLLVLCAAPFPLGFLCREDPS